MRDRLSAARTNYAMPLVVDLLLLESWAQFFLQPWYCEESKNRLFTNNMYSQYFGVTADGSWGRFLF